jgi:hypothetical protein
MSMFKSRRRKIYLGGIFQGALVKRLAIGWAAYHILLFHGLFLVSYLEDTRAQAEATASQSLLERYESFAWQNRLLIFGAVVVGPVFLWDVVRCTHRVAGPLVRLEQTLLKMAKGETVNEIRFRKGDWLNSLERALNLYLSSRAAATETQTGNNGSIAAVAEALQPVGVATEPRVLAQGDHDLNDLLRELRDINETLAALNMGHADALPDSDGFARFGHDRSRRF